MSQVQTNRSKKDSQRPSSRARSGSANSVATNKKNQSLKIEDILERYPDLGNIKAKDSTEQKKKLRQLKADAINSFDFDRSNCIQLYLNLLDQDNTSNVTKQLQDWISNIIIDVIGNYDSNIEEIDQEIEEKEVSIREQINQTFEEMQKKHIKEIEENETLRNIDILREESRIINEVYLLRQQSKRLAKFDEVVQAQQSFEKSNQIEKDNRENELQNIHSKYNKILDQICARQRTEIESLQQRLEELININEKKRQEEKNFQLKQASVFIKSSLQGALNDASKQLNRKENISQVNQELRKTIKQSLKDHNHEKLLDPELDSSNDKI